jgi:hypothetical protein
LAFYHFEAAVFLHVNSLAHLYQVQARALVRRDCKKSVFDLGFCRGDVRKYVLELPCDKPRAPAHMHLKRAQHDGAEKDRFRLRGGHF